MNRPRVLASLLAGAALLSVSGCNRRMLALFFDIPASRSAPVAPPKGTLRVDSVAGTASAAPASTPSVFVPFDGQLNPDSVVKRLPRDHAGNLDWTAALRSGVIRPLESATGGDAASPRLLRFTFDFFLPPGADSTIVTFFPHSGHSEWLSCNSCHLQMFPYRRPVKMSMDDLTEGKYCGACHGPVAFPIETGCERCHPKEEMPAGEARPELLGTTRLRRLAGDTLEPPRAVFPHWVHRTRYLCSACHEQLFEMKAGKSVGSMDLISSGKSCGVCHNGRQAFSADFGACDRCHVPPSKPARNAGERQ